LSEGRRHPIPDVDLAGDYKADVIKIRDFIRNVRDGYSGLPAPHSLTHRVGQQDPLPTPGLPRPIQIGGSSSIGTGPSYMRENAQLIISAGVPVDLGAANAEGAATTVARSNHVHKRSVEVRVNSALVGVRRMVNLIAGAGITLGGVDDAGGDEIDVTITGTSPDPTVARPAQITADQNNYNLGKSHVAFLDLSADWSVTGILATGIPDGWTLLVWNISAFNLIFNHQDAASTAANRIIGQGDANIGLKAGFSGTFTYDLTATRWRGREE
jgi:hypothetical protein